MAKNFIYSQIFTRYAAARNPAPLINAIGQTTTAGLGYDPEASTSDLNVSDLYNYFVSSGFQNPNHQMSQTTPNSQNNFMSLGNDQNFALYNELFGNYDSDHTSNLIGDHMFVPTEQPAYSSQNTILHSELPVQQPDIDTELTTLGNIGEADFTTTHTPGFASVLYSHYGTRTLTLPQRTENTVDPFANLQEEQNFGGPRVILGNTEAENATEVMADSDLKASMTAVDASASAADAIAAPVAIGGTLAAEQISRNQAMQQASGGTVADKYQAQNTQAEGTAIATGLSVGALAGSVIGPEGSVAGAALGAGIGAMVAPSNKISTNDGMEDPNNLPY